MPLTEEEFKELEIAEISHRQLINQSDNVLLDKALDSINGSDSYLVVERYANLLLKDDKQQLFAQIRERIYEDACTWVSYWAAQGQPKEVHPYFDHFGEKVLRHLNRQELLNLHRPIAQLSMDDVPLLSHLEEELRLKSLVQ